MTAAAPAAARAALKAAVCRVIEARREEIVSLGEAIRATPELGYKEYLAFSRRLAVTFSYEGDDHD
jgi:hypothetical protein